LAPCYAAWGNSSDRKCGPQFSGILSPPTRQPVERLEDPASHPSAIRIALIRQLVGPLRCHVHNLVLRLAAGRRPAQIFGIEDVLTAPEAGP